MPAEVDRPLGTGLVFENGTRRQDLQRVVRRGERERRLVRRTPALRLGDELLGFVDVDTHIRPDRQPIPGAAAGDHVDADDAAQAAHQRGHAGLRLRRSARPPQRVDDVVHRDEVATARRQQLEQQPTLSAPELRFVDDARVALDGEATDDAQPQPAEIVRCPDTAAAYDPTVATQTQPAATGVQRPPGP